MNIKTSLLITILITTYGFVNIAQACSIMREIVEISSDSEINHDGNLTVKGNIGSNTILNVNNGKLTVLGNVEDNVKITVSGSVPPVEFEKLDDDNHHEKKAHNNHNIKEKVVVNGKVLRDNVSNKNSSNSMSNTVIVSSSSTGNSNTSITINGETIVGDVPLGVIVKGNIGNNVTIKSENGDITIRNAGNNFNAVTSDSLNAKQIGDKAMVEAANNIRIDKIISGGNYLAKDRATIKSVGKNAAITANRVTIFKCLDKTAVVKSPNKIGGYAAHRPSDSCD